MQSTEARSSLSLTGIALVWPHLTSEKRHNQLLLAIGRTTLIDASFASTSKDLSMEGHYNELQ